MIFAVDDSRFPDPRRDSPPIKWHRNRIYLWKDETRARHVRVAFDVRFDDTYNEPYIAARFSVIFP